MKKNMLTIIILALALVNVVLSNVIIFVIVPNANRTNKLVSKVAQIIDLELESPAEELAITDIKTYDVPGKLTILLKESNKGKNYAQFTVSLSINEKHKDTEKLEEKITENENMIKEMVGDVFQQYTLDEVREKKDEIKDKILTNLRNYFDSDFIINVSFGNLVLD